jgi:hypothetical protein
MALTSHAAFILSVRPIEAAVLCSRFNVINEPDPALLPYIYKRLNIRKGIVPTHFFGSLTPMCDSVSLSNNCVETPPHFLKHWSRITQIENSTEEFNLRASHKAPVRGKEVGIDTASLRIQRAI